MDLKDGLLTALAALFGGGGIWTWIDGRAKRRAAADSAEATGPAALTSANAGLSSALTEHVKLLLAQNDRDRREHRRVIARQDRSIRELTQKVDQCEERHGDCEGSLAAVRAEIEKLMRDNPPADYGDIET